LTNIYWDKKTETEEPEDVVKKEVVLDCSTFWVQKVPEQAGSYDSSVMMNMPVKSLTLQKGFPNNFNELTVPKTMSLR
jgi:hypothetical protein